MATAAELVNVEQLHADSKIGKVKLSDLQFDRSYQRDPSPKLVEWISDNWDEVSSELLLVSDRGSRSQDVNVDGGLWVVNGQHRTLGARKRGLASVHARIIDLTEHPDPASVEATFRIRTNVRLGDKPQERFKAMLRAGDEEALAIQALLARYGTRIGEQPNEEGAITAVVAIERLYRVDDGALLAEAMDLIKSVYGTVGGKSTSSPVITSFAWFITKHASEADRDRIVTKLHEAGYAAFERRARTIGSDMGGALWVNFYRAMISFYNERLQDKGKLEWKLRGATSFRAASSGTWGSSKSKDLTR